MAPSSGGRGGGCRTARGFYNKLGVGAGRQVGAQSGLDLLIGKLVLRAVLRGVALLIGKLVLRAILRTGAAPTKKVLQNPNVDHSLCPNKCFE